MQQTETLKLNLIETGDPISPAPINENAEKLEAALAALDGTAADLQGRVTVLEAKKMVVGTYEGTGSYGLGSQTIKLGFSPLALIVSCYNNAGMVIRDSPTDQLEITATGFVASNSSGIDFNNDSTTYRYIAFA